MSTDVSIIHIVSQKETRHNFCHFFLKPTKTHKCMQYRFTNRNVWIRIMRISSLQLLLALTLTNIGFALDGKAQEMLSRRVSISAQNEDVEVTISRIEKQARVQFLF